MIRQYHWRTHRQEKNESRLAAFKLAKDFRTIYLARKVLRYQLAMTKRTQ